MTQASKPAQAGKPAQRLTYTERNGILTAYLAGHKQGSIQPHDKGAWLHTGHYARATGDLIDSACTLSFRSVKAAKRYLTDLTRYRRNAGAA